jgi:uncharacterized protein YecE (DUF72 family)
MGLSTHGEADRLKAYARFFDFVEVNSTFYTYPELSTVRSWRRRVPRDFEFSVKCHKDISHVFKLTQRRETFRASRHVLMVYRLHRAEVLVL